jgi:violaxanthin de-epoxidase
MLGSTRDAVGLFDPLDYRKQISKAEVKHGRIAMLAGSGFPEVIPVATPASFPRQCAAALAGIAIAAMTPFSAAAAISDPAAVGTCVISQCTGKLAKCLTSPKCAANLVCINTCTGRKDESECQIRCGDLFENEVVGEFNACAVSQKKCVPQRQDDGAYPEPSADVIVKKFSTKIFDGRWYISAGLNEVFDTFDCQVHFFNAATPNTLYGQLNWRIKEPDGEYFTRDTIQKFIQVRPGVLYNHGNDYLHYQDDWYILDYEAGKADDDSDAFALVYYRGRNDAWDGYGGAVLYTRTPNYSASVKERCTIACDKAGLGFKFSDFKAPNNSCSAESASERLLLREKYTEKVLLTGERQIQSELTRDARVAASTIKDDVKEASKAEKKLEKILADFEKEVEKDAIAVEKEVVKDVVKIEREVEQDVFGRGKSREKIEREVVEQVISN